MKKRKLADEHDAELTRHSVRITLLEDSREYNDTDHKSYDTAILDLQQDTTAQRQRVTGLEGRLNVIADRIDGKHGTELPKDTHILNQRFNAFEDSAIKAFASIGERLATIEAPVTSGAGSPQETPVAKTQGVPVSYTDHEGIPVYNPDAALDEDITVINTELDRVIDDYEAHAYETVRRLDKLELHAAVDANQRLIGQRTDINKTADTAEQAEEDATKALNGLNNHSYLFTAVNEDLQHLKDENALLNIRLNTLETNAITDAKDLNKHHNQIKNLEKETERLSIYNFGYQNLTPITDKPITATSESIITPPQPTHRPYPNIEAWNHKTAKHEIYLHDDNPATIRDAIQTLQTLL